MSLVETSEFIERFFALLPPKKEEDRTGMTAVQDSGLTGRVEIERLSKTARAIFDALSTSPSTSIEPAARWYRLFSGDASEYENDRSTADFALARRIRSLGLNHLETEMVMRASPAYREKWDSPRGKVTWLVQTIHNAKPKDESDQTLTIPESDDISNDRGDIRNAKLFATKYRDHYLFVRVVEKWLRWNLDKERWEWCELGEELQAAMQIAQDQVALAKEALASGKDGADKMMRHATRSHDLARLKAMLALAAALPGMSAKQDELDANKDLLGVQNGVVNLKNGRLIRNKPCYLITKFCNANFNQAAECPKWNNFHNSLFPKKPDMIGSLQRLMGYTITGHNGEEVLPICYGDGQNGKSIYANVSCEILGAYSVTAPPSLLIARRENDTGPRNDIACLHGSRMVSVNELAGSDSLDEPTVKRLAGREKLSARFLHREFIVFEPTFTVWLRTNHKPIIRGTDSGIWRRIVLIHFDQKFTGDQCNPNLEQELLEERDGILAWMVAGAVSWYQNGLNLCDAIKAETAQYREDSDLLSQFLEDRCEIATDAFCSQKSLYAAWVAWMDENGHHKPSKTSLTRRLIERGFGKSKSGSERRYTGLKIR